MSARQTAPPRGVGSKGSNHGSAPFTPRPLPLSGPSASKYLGDITSQDAACKVCTRMQAYAADSRASSVACPPHSPVIGSSSSQEWCQGVSYVGVRPKRASPGVQ